jgi:phage terminase large subunit
MYSKGFTIPDIVFHLNYVSIPKWDYIWCDSAEPMLIADLKRNGFYAKKVVKQSILSGIEKIKRHKVFIHRDSHNLKKEFQSYSWRKDPNGNMMDIPEDKNNHLIDALRYVLDMNLNKGKKNIRVV